MKTLTYILKASLGVALIAYMIYSGKLDLGTILNVKEHPWMILSSISAILIGIVVTYYRWKMLLSAQGIYFNSKDLFPIFYIGLFFSSILPGVVSGDIIKSAYIVKRAPDKKASAVMTIILDRVIGLMGLMLICCIGFAINLNIVWQHSALRALAIIMGISLIVLIMFSIIGLSKRIGKTKLFNYFMEKAPFSNTVKELYEAFHIYRKKRKILIYALLISLLNHALAIMGFFIITRALGFGILSIKSYLFIVPTGMLTAAIPITPAGIGVGQAAFLKLFEWSIGTRTTVGADAITIWQAICLLIFMFGVYFYVTYRRTLKE